MSEKKRWSEFTQGQKAAVIAGATIEIVLTTVALVDLARRPRAAVWGPKAVWALGCLIQPMGPVAYLALGRRPLPE